MENRSNRDNLPSRSERVLPGASRGDSSGITRRSFMRYAGIGIGTVVFANPFLAFADEENAPTTGDAPGNITGTFKFGGSNQANFVFDQSFFNGSSFDYSNQVSTFALCLALSAFGANDDQSKYEESPNNVGDFMAKLRCKDITYNDDYTKLTEHDSIGLACAHRTIQADDTTYELVLMGIRGANYFFEWCGNLAAGESNDHQGFITAANKALNFLESYVTEHVPSDNPLKIVISGFSRASATANMAGGLLVRSAWQNDLPKNEASSKSESSPKSGYVLGGKEKGEGSIYPFPKHVVHQKDVYVYGFEVPSGAYSSATVDADVLSYWSSNFGMNPFGNIYSIVNPCDLVPKVMPLQWTFGRFGVDRFLPRPSDSDYGSARDAMLARADTFDSGFRSKYPVDSFDHLSMPMNVFFDTMIDKLVHDLTGSRPTYHRDYETPLVDLMNYMQEGKIYKLEKTSSSTAFKAWLWTDIICRALPCVLIPVVGLIELAVVAIKILANALSSSILAEVVSNLRLAGLEWGDEEQKLYSELNRICPMIDKFAKSNISLFIAMLKVFMKDPNTMECHSGTLCLAWMQSYDPNYSNSASSASLPAAEGELEAEGGNDGLKVEGGNDDLRAASPPSAYRKVLFDGDIIVSMAGESGYTKLFEGGKPVDAEGFPYAYGLNEDFQMCVVLPVPLNSDFMFKIESSLEDRFTITSVRYEIGGQAPSRILSYNAIGNNHETIYATVRKDAVLVSDSEDQRSVYGYSIDINNVEENKETHCDVQFDSADEAMGLVAGGGYNVYGTSSMLVAIPNDGYEFDYWSVNGERDENPVKTDSYTDEEGITTVGAVYPFYVNNDYGESVKVLAHFKQKTPAPKSDDKEASTPVPEKQPAGTPSSTAKTDDAAGAAAMAAGVAAASAAAVARLGYKKSGQE